MNAMEIMARQVITIDSDDSLEHAIGLMLRNGISGLPVVDGKKKLVGIVTEGDLLRRAETGTERKRPHWLEFLLGPGRLAADYVHAHSRKVEDVMTREVLCVPPDATLDTIVDIMERKHIKRVPVVEDGRLVGIVSRANLLQALAAAANAIPPTASSDEEIRRRLWDELEKSQWAPCGLINFVVRNGVVHLHGTITDGREREAIRTAAANIPGVREVHDRLVWCDPMTGTVIEQPGETEDKA